MAIKQTNSLYNTSDLDNQETLQDGQTKHNTAIEREACLGAEHSLSLLCVQNT